MQKTTERNINAIAEELMTRKGKSFGRAVEFQKAIDPERTEKVMREVALLMIAEVVREMAEQRRFKEEL